LSSSRKLVGILAPLGRVRQCDLNAFASAELNFLRLRAEANSPTDIALWRDAGATEFVVHLLSPLASQIRQTPEMFVDYFSTDIQAFLEGGARHFEVHDKPNRFDRGAGISWPDGDGFASWFFETLRLLRIRFGDTIQVGFPALFPTDLLRSDPGSSLDEITFSEQCADAMAAADWVAIHTYWRRLREIGDYQTALRFLHLYMEKLPKQQFIVTEFANVNPHIASEMRGREYADFFTAVGQYDRILGACSLVLRSSERLYEPLAWLDADGHPRPLLSEVVKRPYLPDPERLCMFWPTEYHQYNQYFGANQQTYFKSRQLAGGHNGVDLRVNRLAPNTSPIYAALAGTVVQVSLEKTGYGYHIRIRSYGLVGEEITLLYAHLSAVDVAVGMLVNKGDVLGHAGSTGDVKSPHLHFGMRVKDVQNLAVGDWLNPRPYLDAGLVCKTT
jgi:hypothetical protein